MPMQQIAAPISALLLVAFLSACNRQPADQAEVNIAAEDGDPALTETLGNQIVVDPKRVDKPVTSADNRPTLGERARQQATGSDCARRVHYDRAWAGKLPAEFPLYPAATLTEAAGTDAAGCRMRVISFTSAAPITTILDFYQNRATHAGYSAERAMDKGDHILAGTRDRDGGVYYLIAAPAKGGSAIDIIVDTKG